MGRKLQAKSCFVCGHDNPRGLNIPFYSDGEVVTARFTPDASLCGYDGIVHGGVIYTVADEAMMYLLWTKQIAAMTVEGAIRYHHYAHAGERLIVRAQIEQLVNRLICASATIIREDDIKIATANGKFLKLKDKERDNFKKVF